MSWFTEGADGQAAPPAVAPAQSQRRRYKSVPTAAAAYMEEAVGRAFAHTCAHAQAIVHTYRISRPSGAPDARRRRALIVEC